MASIARRDVEILAHITAPSRGSDDARYRTLAQAYLDFECVERYNISDGLIGDEVEEAETQLQEELARSTQNSQASYQPLQEDPESIPMSIRSSQNVYLNRIQELEDIPSPMLSFNSVLDNSDSPRFRNFGVSPPALINGSEERSRIADSQQSYKPPSSTIADSQPEVERPAPAFSSPSGIWEIFLRQVESSETRQTSLHAGGNQQDQQSASPQLPIGIQGTPSASATAGPEKSSTPEEPSSPSPKMRAAVPQNILKVRNDNVSSTQDPAAGLKRKRLQAAEENTHSSSAPSRLLTGNNTPSSSNEAVPKRPRIGVDEVNTSGSRSFPSSKTTEVATSSPAISKLFWANKVEIRPAPPEISTGGLTPEKLITNTLRNLAMKMSIDDLFIPEEQTRAVRPTERGYWLVSCQNWDSRLRQRCWEYLGNCVGKGLAGWGVWCVRDEEFETIRVYCWGTVVAHIYLLLYLASESRMKKSAASWIGGDGQAILIM